MTTSTNYLQAFRERRAYCQALVELSQQQRQLIENDNYTELLSLLNHKQQLLDGLLASGSPQGDLWHDWKLERDHLSPKDRDACETELQQTEDFLQQLMEHEELCTTQLTTQRDAVETALRSVQRAGAALDGYATSTESRTFRRLDFGL